MDKAKVRLGYFTIASLYFSNDRFLQDISSTIFSSGIVVLDALQLPLEKRILYFAVCKSFDEIDIESGKFTIVPGYNMIIRGKDLLIKRKKDAAIIDSDYSYSKAGRSIIERLTKLLTDDYEWGSEPSAVPIVPSEPTLEETLQGKVKELVAKGELLT